jgi:hypothetical protein
LVVAASAALVGRATEVATTNDFLAQVGSCGFSRRMVQFYLKLIIPYRLLDD